VFFAWGEIYSIFPSTARNHFGQKYATTNYGMLYTAKGTALLVVPLASVLSVATGKLDRCVTCRSMLQHQRAVMAIAVLYPVRLREIRKAVGIVPEITATPPVAMENRNTLRGSRW
jgi:OFA family oxalate/formate antiporter-like MFS transporter